MAREGVRRAGAGPVATVPPGRTVTVTTPATSANLGPGFDTFGLALDWADTCTATVIAEPHRVAVTGLGAETLPCDGAHLVVSAAMSGLSELGASVGGLHLVAHNTIPQSRGLGTSAAAIVAGLGIAWGLARPGVPLDLAWAVRTGGRLEGHPDNVAAAVLGGFVQAWTEPGGARAVSAPVAAGVVAHLYVPEQDLATKAARALLPATVSHADAALNAARAALMVTALGQRPDLLFVATEDRLHQRYREPAMPRSCELVGELRAAGQAAVISGAGPAVLVLGTAEVLAGLPSCPGFTDRRLGIGAGVRVQNLR